MINVNFVGGALGFRARDCPVMVRKFCHGAGPGISQDAEKFISNKKSVTRLPPLIGHRGPMTTTATTATTATRTLQWASVGSGVSVYSGVPV